MSKIISIAPPHLYDALKAEGFELPRNCGDIQLEMPVAGAFVLVYRQMLEGDDLVKIGSALKRMGLRPD